MFLIVCLSITDFEYVFFTVVELPYCCFYARVLNNYFVTYLVVQACCLILWWILFCRQPWCRNVLLMLRKCLRCPSNTLNMQAPAILYHYQNLFFLMMIATPICLKLQVGVQLLILCNLKIKLKMYISRSLKFVINCTYIKFVYIVIHRGRICKR